MIKDKCVNELGFEQVNIDSVGNVIATKGTGEPASCFVATWTRCRAKCRCGSKTATSMAEGRLTPRRR